MKEKISGYDSFFLKTLCQSKYYSYAFSDDVNRGNRLFYHTWQKDEKHNYEIDFLLSRRNKLCPVEVKSSGYSAHASLDAFCRKYSLRVERPYLIYTKNFRQEEGTVYLPAYMTQLL